MLNLYSRYPAYYITSLQKIHPHYNIPLSKFSLQIHQRDWKTVQFPLRNTVHNKYFNQPPQIMLYDFYSPAFNFLNLREMFMN